MRVQIAQPVTTHQIETHLRATFPQYSVINRSGIVIVGDGAATGVMIKPSGQNAFTLAWGFPSMAVQMVLTLTIVLTGILPGLLAFGIVWLVVRSGVDRLKREVSTVMMGGVAPQPALDPSAPRPPAPGAALTIGGVASFLMALFGLLSVAAMPGARGNRLLDLVFWIVLGVSLLMLHTEAKLANQGAPRRGPARMVLGVAAVLNGLLSFVFLFDAQGGYVVRLLVDGLFWLATGGILIASHLNKLPAAVDGKKLSIGMFVAGGVFALFGVLSLVDVVTFLESGMVFNFFALLLVPRILLHFVLAAAAVMQGVWLQRGPLAPAVASMPQQPSYPQAAYPQLSYPQPAQPAYAQPYPQQYAQPAAAQQWPGNGA